MGGTIIHTTSKEATTKAGDGVGNYGPRTKRKKRERTIPTEILHWTTANGEDANNRKFLRKQNEMVEALVILLRESLDSKTARHGLSLNSAEFVARQAGFKGGKDVAKAVDRAGASLVARAPERYMFKGDLVLTKMI